MVCVVRAHLRQNCWPQLILCPSLSYGRQQTALDPQWVYLQAQSVTMKRICTELQKSTPTGRKFHPSGSLNVRDRNGNNNTESNHTAPLGSRLHHQWWVVLVTPTAMPCFLLRASLVTFGLSASVKSVAQNPAWLLSSSHSAPPVLCVLCAH